MHATLKCLHKYLPILADVHNKNSLAGLEHKHGVYKSTITRAVGEMQDLGLVVITPKSDGPDFKYKVDGHVLGIVYGHAIELWHQGEQYPPVVHAHDNLKQLVHVPADIGSGQDEQYTISRQVIAYAWNVHNLYSKPETRYAITGVEQYHKSTTALVKSLVAKFKVSDSSARLKIKQIAEAGLFTATDGLQHWVVNPGLIAALNFKKNHTVI